MKYTDVMLDLETLSTRPNAVIVSIGAVKFNLNEEDTWESLEGPDRSIEILLNIRAQEGMGRHIDVDTIKWWITQNEMAKHIFNTDVFTPLSQDLEHFTRFCKGTVNLWGNGASFDNVLLRDLYMQLGLEFPFNWWEDKDLRTLKAVSGRPTVTVPRGTAHNALDDAKYQVLCAQQYYMEIQDGKEARDGADRGSEQAA